MICVSMGYPTVEEEMEILKRGQKKSRDGQETEVILDAEQLLSMRSEV